MCTVHQYFLYLYDYEVLENVLNKYIKIEHNALYLRVVVHFQEISVTYSFQ